MGRELGGCQAGDPPPPTSSGGLHGTKALPRTHFWGGLFHFGMKEEGPQSGCGARARQGHPTAKLGEKWVWGGGAGTLLVGKVTVTVALSE